MRYLIITLLVPSLLSCSEPERAKETFPYFPDIEDEVITYEGVLPLKDGLTVTAELSLVPASPGLDSYYWLTELLDDSFLDKFAFNSRTQGAYAVFNGPDRQYIVQLLNRRRMSAIIRRNGEMPVPDYTVDNVYLKNIDDEELVLVDVNFREIVPRYTLVRRSDLFTVEGYLTVFQDSTAEYFERNTRKTWPVARLGHSGEAVSQYHWLAKEKFEGIYVKALAYTVRQKNKDGNVVDAVVFKKILDIHATKPLE